MLLLLLLLCLFLLLLLLVLLLLLLFLQLLLLSLLLLICVLFSPFAARRQPAPLRGRLHRPRCPGDDRAGGPHRIHGGGHPYALHPVGQGLCAVLEGRVRGPADGGDSRGGERRGKGGGGGLHHVLISSESTLRDCTFMLSPPKLSKNSRETFGWAHENSRRKMLCMFVS